MKVITSKDNAEYKRALSLYQKKHRQRERRFPVEGLRALTTACEQQIYPVELWLSETAGEKYAGCWSAIDERTIRIVPDEMLRRLSQTEESQGAVGIFSLDVLPKSVREMVQDTIVVLDQVQDPGNAGTIVRTAAAAGCREVWTTHGTVDLFNPKTVRSTMGGLFQIPVRTDVDPEDIVAISRKDKRKIYAAALQHSVPYTEMRPASKTFWVFGNEGNGITDSVLCHADDCYCIPLHNGVESLNVAMAASVLLFYYRGILDGS